MNAAARDLQHGSLFHGSIGRFAISKETVGVLSLVSVMLFSAFSVVYVKNYERRLFNELQSAHQERDQIQVEWGQLLLEQSTWATPARVQMIAQKRFGMQMPTADNTVMIDS